MSQLNTEQQELSNTQVLINLKVLWGLVLSIIVGTSCIVMIYADIKSDNRTMTLEIQYLKADIGVLKQKIDQLQKK